MHGHVKCFDKKGKKMINPLKIKTGEEKDNILGFCVVRSISVSPQKINLILDSIRGESVVRAKSILLFHSKRAAPIILNALKNAISMAQLKNGFAESELQIHSIYSGLQRITKQVIPQARGKRGVRKRRSSHIYLSVKQKDVKIKFMSKIKGEEVSNGK